jgi:hypothetical protein
MESGMSSILADSFRGRGPSPHRSILNQIFRPIEDLGLSKVPEERADSRFCILPWW